MNELSSCPVCGFDQFKYTDILWDELIEEWQILPHEVDYINRQQGLTCKRCDNNLRTMALANAILNSQQFSGNLYEFVDSDQASKLRLIEVNPAGNLTTTLKRLQNHRMMSYPEVDLCNLSLLADSVDMIIHSDTLEHVIDPRIALAECYRALTDSGSCIFTTPIILSRWTRLRRGLKESFHSIDRESNKDYLVHTEFGVDIWQWVLEAGFSIVKFHCLEYPSGLAIEAVKRYVR